MTLLQAEILRGGKGKGKGKSEKREKNIEKNQGKGAVRPQSIRKCHLI